MYEAKMILDSIASNGSRLTTMQLTYPRFVHSEFMTHRLFSRNSASSRAIPIKKMIEAVLIDPVIPVEFGKNQSGMQSKVLLQGLELDHARNTWLSARLGAISQVQQLDQIGVHKQLANRILEPWMWITVIVSATEWANFFRLRCHEDAQPEIRFIANMAKELYDSSTPRELDRGQWHMPYADDVTHLYTENRLKIATGRIARVSYLTHEGKRDITADIELHDRLINSKHWSPFEHCAQVNLAYMPSNFSAPWLQYRKLFMNESGKNDT
jgi:thymidylate synthase ThyX